MTREDSNFGFSIKTGAVCLVMKKDPNVYLHSILNPILGSGHILIIGS